jgi:hypothetical protein
MPPREEALFEETKRRPLTSVNVRCDPRPKKLTNVCPTVCVPCVVLSGLESDCMKPGVASSAWPTFV